MKDVDVVIIGAGSAGLAAAKTLRTARLSFLLLEAMEKRGPAGHCPNGGEIVGKFLEEPDVTCARSRPF